MLICVQPAGQKAKFVFVEDLIADEALGYPDQFINGSCRDARGIPAALTGLAVRTELTGATKNIDSLAHGALLGQIFAFNVAKLVHFPFGSRPFFAWHFFSRSRRASSMLPGEIECNQDHEEKEPVTQNTNNNASPSLAHSGLFPLRQEPLLFHFLEVGA